MPNPAGRNLVLTEKGNIKVFEWEWPFIFLKYYLAVNNVDYAPGAT
jgi:hypothetical protein